MRFAKLISAQSCRNYGIAYDNSGHVYIGVRASRPTLSPSAYLRIGYDTTVTGDIYRTQFLAQFDTTGEFNWMRYIGDNSIPTLAGAGIQGTVAVDGDNNAHLIVLLGSGVPITPSVTSTLGIYDFRYDASGNLLSHDRLQLDSTLSMLGDACIDRQTNKLYAYGSRLWATFTDSSRYPYVAAFDTDRNLIWIDTLASPPPGASASAFPTFNGITTDHVGHLYLTGYRAGRIAYQSDTFMSTLGGGTTFVMKLDTDSHVNWILPVSGSSSTCGLLPITITPNGNVVAAGGLYGTLVAGNDTITSYGSEGLNAVFIRVDTAGFLDTIQQIHGWGDDGSRSITSDRKGNVYIGGEVESGIWGSSLSPYTSVGGNSDFFIMKYGVDCDCTVMPVAAFTDTGTITHGFTYTGTTTPVIDSVRWDFGDGGTSTLMNPIHSYTTADTFHACVRVYTACGHDLYCKDVAVPCITGPTPAFAMSGSGLTRTFTYTGTPTGVTSISWSFSDGGAATGSPASHTFAAAATYTACVTASNACGIATTCNPIVITCTATPISAYTVSVGAGLTKTFTYTGTTAGLDSVTWTFGDGGIATGLMPGHTYSAAGTYTACATVYTNCGIHTICSPLTVTCVTPPVAAFTSSGTGLTRFFIYTGTTAGMDSVTWTFSDGGTATGTTPTHTFPAAGVYTVCVTVHTNCGSHTFCMPINVSCSIAPAASFSYIVAGASVSFSYTGTTSPTIDSMRWDFGDGGTSTLTSPSHTYATEDTFHVCVTVYTNCGSDTYCQEVIVTCFTPVTAAFTDTGVLVHGFAYTGTMAGYDSVRWTYGDGGSDTGLNVIHTFAVADTYYVCATVYTDCGTNTFCRNIIIGTVGISDAVPAAISVYPNPSRSELRVANVPQQMEYRIVNVVGVVMLQGALHEGGNTLPIDALPVGTYLLEMSGVDGSRKVARFVKM
ncbi:MAG: PKD domain-containing protein [Taibaiella sp.]|nr:PKD domain-containing protein [Taibaiella sp.]